MLQARAARLLEEVDHRLRGVDGGAAADAHDDVCARGLELLKAGLDARDRGVLADVAEGCGVCAPCPEDILHCLHYVGLQRSESLSSGHGAPAIARRGRTL